MEIWLERYEFESLCQSSSFSVLCCRKRDCLWFSLIHEIPAVKRNDSVRALRTWQEQLRATGEEHMNPILSEQQVLVIFGSKYWLLVLLFRWVF